jgi:hypothetical protein
MPDYDVHDPSYDGTTEADWDAPRKSDFDTDALGEIADHFLLSSSGFPPEAFGDLQLPVVEPGGNLSLEALETAHGGAHGVTAVEGIDDETVEEVQSRIESLAEDAFDHQLG